MWLSIVKFNALCQSVPGKESFPWLSYSWLNLPQLRTWKVGLLETTPQKDCPWSSLEGTIPGSPHYPDASSASGIWTLKPQLLVERAPPGSWNRIPPGDVKLKLTRGSSSEAYDSLRWTALQDHGSNLHLPHETFISLPVCFLPFLSVNAEEDRISQTIVTSGN